MESSAMPSSAPSIDDSHVERVTETKRGGATVHVSSTDGVSIDACITLRAKSKSLEFRTKVDWRASERFLKVDIPMAIQADRAQYECQYGMVERPIQKNTHVPTRRNTKAARTGSYASPMPAMQLRSSTPAPTVPTFRRFTGTRLPGRCVAR